MAFRLAAFYFAFFAYGGAYVAYFPLYLVHRGLSPVEAAWVLALPPLARTLAPPAWGWLADRTGAHRAVVVFSCIVTTLAFALLPYTDHIALVIGVMSVLSAGALPIVEATTLKAHFDKYGPIRLWGSIGFIAVVLAGGAWLDFRPVSTLPRALVIFSVATLIVALALPGAEKSRVDAKGAFRLTPEIACLLAAGFCNAVAHGALYAFLSVHLAAIGYSGTAIGALWTLGVVAEIVVFLYLGALFRRFSLSTILAASLGLGVIRFLAIGWAADRLWIVLLAQVLHAATFGSFHAAAVAAVHRLLPEGAQARGQALFSGVTYGAGAAAGLVISGWAWSQGGAAMAFSVSSTAALIGAFFAAKVRRAGH